MKEKKKNRSHRCDIKRPTSRHGLTYTKYKKCLSMMILICIKQHPTNTWGSIYEKVKEHWDWVEKNVLLIKHKRVRQKAKTLKRQKSTETVLNQKILIAKRLSRKLGTSILFGIAIEHNCFKIQFSICMDNFEQYFQTAILKTQNYLESFIITWKVFTPLKNSRLFYDLQYGDNTCLYGSVENH